MSVANYLNGWLPVKIITGEEELLCQWMYTGDQPFNEPFFSDTLLRCKQLPENKHGFKVVSSIQMLQEWMPITKTLQPTVFIFHVSRCGSTTLTQLLDLDPANRTLSEVPIFDEILRLPYTHPQSGHADAIEKYFRAALTWYSQPHHENENRLYIKTDSWHLHFYTLLRTWYPDIPFLVITRTPGEVLQSQNRQRGVQSVPGLLEPAIFGLNREDLSFDLDRHMEKVLVTYFEKIIDLISIDTKITVADYSEGMETILKKTLQLTNADYPSAYEAAVQTRLQFDGKHPRMFFNPQPPSNEIEASDHCIELYQEVQRLCHGR